MPSFVNRLLDHSPKWDIIDCLGYNKFLLYLNFEVQKLEIFYFAKKISQICIRLDEM